MANGVGFQGANFIMRAPDTMSQDECEDLQVFRDGKQVISCWRLSENELSEINETGVVWLSVIGNGMPPVVISGNALVHYNGKPSKAEPVLPKAPRREE